MTDIKLQQLQSALEGLGAKNRSDLLPALHAAQEIYGHISDATAAEIATALKIPLSEVHGVIEFYALFYNKPVGQTVLHVCNDPVCSIAGADGIFKRMTQKVTLSFEVAGKTADVTVERARGNIDIGGPCMVRASAKNFIRVASVTDPADYAAMLSELQGNDGTIGLETRLALARKAFGHTADYDGAISAFLNASDIEHVRGCYAIA